MLRALAQTLQTGFVTATELLALLAPLASTDKNAFVSEIASM